MEKRAPRLGDKATRRARQHAAWLTTTALTAILLSPGVLNAQTLATTTTPQGGEVVGGSATITQSTGSTVIDQSSQRTAINWQSFNVGSAATVQFNQPSSTAIAVNQVVSANPSIIAGKISANGQIVLVNQSGVVFTHGAQVNAESIVVSTSSVATKDFMAGRLVFSGAPNPGAKIVNDGQLTARQAGLVGLVAPQVINNGVITARLGQVVLAGASAFTLDLYGDKLVSLDVTQAVRAVDVGGKLMPALVTNNGVIIADGGTITLTAQDADALVTQLVNAGGTIRADTVGAKTGTIAIEGVGGNIQIAGNLLAQGSQAGTKGGAIEALATGTVSVASTAVIDASGAAGGGVVALGTDIARARAGGADSAAPRAAVVQVASGAHINANATATGNGGKVVLLSSQETDFGGTIAVGGATGGTGGLAEISSDNVISLSGTVYDTSLDGQAGEILLDPGTLIVGTGGTAASIAGTTTIGGLTGTNSVSYVDPSSLISLSGTIVLEANKLLSVASAINLTGASALTLLSDGNVTIGASIDTIGSLEIDATGSLVVNAGLTATSIAVSDAGGGAIMLGASVVATQLTLQSGGGVTEVSGGVIDVGTLDSGTLIDGNVQFGNVNTIATLGTFAVLGSILLNNAGSLDIAGVVSTQQSLTLEDTAGISESSGGMISAATFGSGGTTIGGDVSLENGNSINVVNGLTLGGTSVLGLEDTAALKVTGTVDAGTATISAAALTLAAPVSVANALVLESSGGITEATGGVIDAATLSSGGTTIGGAVALGKVNTIGTLAGFTAAGNILLDNAGSLEIAGLVSTAGALTLEGGSVGEAAGGSIDATTLTSGGTAIGGDVSLGSANDIGALNNLTLSGTSVLTLNDTGALNVTGTVNAGGATLNAAGLTLAAPVSVANALVLESSGGITEAVGGVIDAATLSSGGTTIGGAVSLANANDVATLGGLALASGFALVLTDTGSLSVAGTLDADSATINAAALTLAAPVSVTNALVLASGGRITEAPGGTISAATLSSGGTTIGGAVTLGNANTIGTLGGFTAAGNILLNNAGALEIAGLVSTAGVLTLEGGGASEMTGGMIDAATLSSGGTTIGGDVSLGSANEIGALNDLTLSGTSVLTLNDAGALNVTGAVNAGGATLNAAGLTLAAPVSVTNTLVLESAGNITETAGGGISAAQLTSGGTTIAGAVSLTGANTIATLGGFAASGDFTLDTTGSLTVAAPLQASDVTLIDNGTMTLDAVLQAAGGQARLVADGLLEGSGGAVSVGSGGTIAIAPFTSGTMADLGGTAAGGLELSNQLFAGLDPNADLIIGKAGSFTAGGIFTEGALSIANPALLLSATGQITQTGTLSANAVTLAGSSLALDGDLTATTLHLLSSGGITQPGSAVLSVGTLDSGGTTIGGAVALDGSANAIATLGGFAATQGFTLDDAAALVVNGPVTAASISLTDGSTNASSLAIDGTLAANSGGTISLVANAITAAGASISAPGGVVAFAPYTDGTAIDLGGTAAGLDLSSTLIGAISGATSLVEISTSGSIAADGSVSLAPAVLSLNGDGVVFNGTLTVPEELELTSSNGVSETAGAQLTTGTLLAGGAISGPVNLALGDNNIGTLGAISLSGSNGDLSLSDAVALRLSGPVNAQNVALNAAGLTIANVISAGGAVTLDSSAGVVENGGAIDALSLTSGGTTIAGAALLGGANTIGVLNGFAASGDVLVNDTGALTVAGNVAGANITLVASGLTLAGDVSTPGLLALASPGDVTQSAGTISAATVSSDGGVIGGSVNLAQAGNALQTVAGFAASGNVALASSGLLDVTGPLTAANIALNASGIAVNGVVSTSQLQLASSAGVSEGQGGQVTASTLTTGGATVTGDIALNTAGNQIGTLGAVNATGGLALNDASALNLDAPVTLGGALALLDAVSITQTGGGISATALTSDGGTIGGDASFGSAFNAISVLGDFAARGNVLVADTTPLALQGNISTGDVLSLDSGGAITQGSGIISTALLNASATSISLPSANQIGALGVVTSGNIDIAGVSGISGQVTANNAAFSTGGNFTFGGNAQITGALDVNANGNITQSTGNVSAQTATLASGGNIVLSGDMAVTGDLDLIAAANITHGQGVLDAGTLTGSADTLASFGSTTDFGTLGSFIMQDSLFSLNNAGALTIVGPVVANVVRVTAQGVVTLEGSTTGGLFITGVVEPSSAITPNATDSVISSTGGANSAPSIIVNGVFQVNAGPYAQNYLGNAGQPATVFFDTLPTGTMNFGANGTGVLDGPSVGFELAAGQGGTVTGNLNAKHLEILSALSADLNGSIDGIDGTTAAGNGDAFPFPQPALRFNACPIGSVNCTILPTEALPSGNPLENFDISSRKRKRLGHNVELPGIATRDF